MSLNFLVAAGLLFPAAFFGQDKAADEAHRKQPLTVSDAIETHQVLGFGPLLSEPVLLSPNGKRYVFVVQHGDVARNGIWIEFYSASTASLGEASKFTIVKLFTHSTAESRDLVKDVRWLADNRSISFLWDDGVAKPQVVILDLQTRQLQKLTRHRSSIVAYDVSADGRTLIYTAEAPRDKLTLVRMSRAGFAVTGESLFELLDDSGDWLLPSDQYKTFVQNIASGVSHRMSEPHQKWTFPPNILSFSPDGQYAVMTRPAFQVPQDWDLYTNDLFKRVHLAPARSHPEEANWLNQFSIIDIRSGQIKPLWQAPAFGAVQILWSPDSRHVVVGPTFLPSKNADAEGLAGRSVAIVDINEGNFVPLPVGQNSLAYGYAPVHWNKDGVIELGDPMGEAKESKEFFREISGVWSRIGKEGEKKKDGPEGKIRIEERQDPNTPPSIVAVDGRTGGELTILELDPKLKTDFTLGRVEKTHWTATDGKAWTGMLYYPVGYQVGKRFPLVIQTHGYGADEFSLSGSFTTAFAAQPLANRDIAVLQVGGPDQEEPDSVGTPREVEISMDGFQGAIQHFTEIGLADPQKVGLAGFSRTYWHVAYMLTHSQMPVSAAVIADGVDGSYLQYAISDGAGRKEFENDIGAAPFREGLSVWMRNAPGFNADKIQAALRMEVDSGPLVAILGHWELFAHLRYLHKPAELYVIPDIQHGAHVLQNPAQRLASQGGTVDWFDFWLNGHEDSAPAKREQYARWQGLRKLQSGKSQGIPTVHKDGTAEH